MQDDDITLNENKYLITSLTRACSIKNDKIKTRLPLQKGMVNLIVNETDKYFEKEHQHYLGCLYRALFAASYYGMLRIGELTTGTHPILALDVHIARNKNKILFVLRTSKTHGKGNKPQMVKISSSGNHEAFAENCCSFGIIQEFIDIRGSCIRADEPLFVFSDRTPVQPNNMRNILKKMIKNIGLDPNVYGVHSFRGEEQMI